MACEREREGEGGKRLKIEAGEIFARPPHVYRGLSRAYVERALSFLRVSPFFENRKKIGKSIAAR